MSMLYGRDLIQFAVSCRNGAKGRLYLVFDGVVCAVMLRGEDGKIKRLNCLGPERLEVILQNGRFKLCLKESRGRPVGVVREVGFGT